MTRKFIILEKVQNIVPSLCREHKRNQTCESPDEDILFFTVYDIDKPKISVESGMKSSASCVKYSLKAFLYKDYSSRNLEIH